MEHLKERLNELEIRVKHLENEIQSLRNQPRAESTQSGSPSVSPPPMSQPAISIQPVAPQPAISIEPVGVPVGAATVAQPIGSRPMGAPVGNMARPPQERVAQERAGGQAPKVRKASFSDKFKNNESLVGKYLVGALASLLIFIAAASFVAIMWNQIRPEIKLGVVSIAGLVLSSLGFAMTLKKSSNISSILFGTGIGLVYIAIVSANLVFGMIPHEISALLGVLWTVLIMVSHRYTKLYFTMVIASIGNFINLFLEFNYVRDPQDMMLLIGTTSVVSALLLFMSHRLDRIRHAVSIYIAFFHFVLIFLATHLLDGYLYTWEQGIATLILILLSNWMYRLSDRENLRYGYFVLAAFSTWLLYWFVFDTLTHDAGVGITLRQASILFFLLIAAQWIVNPILYPKIQKPLTLFYTFPLYVASVIFYDVFFEIWRMGAAPLLLLFVLRKLFAKQEIPVAYLMFYVFLDFALGYDQQTAWTLSFNLANLILLFYALYLEPATNIMTRHFALILAFLGYFKIAKDISHLMRWDVQIAGIENVLAYLMCAVTLVVVHQTRYLESAERPTKYHPHLGLYVYSTLLYLFGLQEMLEVDSVLLRFVTMLATLVMILFQSRMLLTDHKEVPPFVGIWLVVKYFIFAWAAMRAFWQLPFDSVSYSVVGLLLAIAAIYAGFQWNVKTIRQFGLAITMLMVAKFIFVDLQGENSITRVAAFATGGVLCFIISIIYNRLSKE